MAYYTGKNATNQTAAIGAVVVLHVAVISAFASGLVRKIVDVAVPPIIYQPVPDEKEPTSDPEPPRDPGDIYNPMRTHLVPEPPVVVVLDQETTRTGPTDPTRTGMGDGAGSGPELVAARPISPKSGARPTPRYPGISQRLGEAGLVTVRYCLGADGHVNAKASGIITSSGYPRLDQAALDQVRSGGWDRFFVPATAEGGAPVEACARVPFRFNLK